MNTGEENSDPIPIDLIIDILSRLSAKSIGRFRCVSKLWSSTLSRPDFIEMFQTRSLARPRLLFAFDQWSKWRFFSLPKPQNTEYEKSSSLVVSADLHIKFPQDQDMSIYNTYSRRFKCCYASGLIYFPKVLITLGTESDALISQATWPVICNPITGQYVILPELRMYSTPYSFLGFDPIDKQFKILSMAYPDRDNMEDHQILTLGTEKTRWRTIQCRLTHKPLSDGICINGVIYYLAQKYGGGRDMIVCFDDRSEKFKFINAKCFCDPRKTTLINYNGKLGGISWKYVPAGGRRTCELRMCVLEDVEKKEWSKYVYTVSENKDFNPDNVLVAGVTTTGEIVFSQKHRSGNVPFYVFYFNLERDTLHSVEIQGLDENGGEVYAFGDHVEDLNGNDAKLLKSSQGLNIIRKRRKRQKRHTSVKKRRRQSS